MTPDDELPIPYWAQCVVGSIIAQTATCAVLGAALFNVEIPPWAWIGCFAVVWALVFGLLRTRLGGVVLGMCVTFGALLFVYIIFIFLKR